MSYEALRLADVLAAYIDSNTDFGKAAAELSRQHTEIERLQAEIAANKTLVNGEAVRIPTSATEAALMVRLGMQYLREHAPDRLAAETDAALSDLRGELWEERRQHDITRGVLEMVRAARDEALAKLEKATP